MGVEHPTKFSKRAVLTRSNFYSGVAGKEWGDFFQGGCNFYIKNKLKSQIFKRWDGAKNEKFYHHGDSQKNLIGGWGGVTKNQYIEENCLKRGAWTVRKSKGGLAKRGRGCFLGVRVDTQMHTMFRNSSVHLVNTSLIRLVLFHPLNTFLPDVFKPTVTKKFSTVAKKLHEIMKITEI